MLKKTAGIVLGSASILNGVPFEGTPPVPDSPAALPIGHFDHP